MQRLYTFCLILLFFVSAAKAQNPCDIIVSVNKGCVPLPVEFKLSTTDTSAPKSYAWDFGDGDNATQNNPTHIYKSAGSYTPKLTVIFRDGTECTVSLTKPIIVYHNPNAAFLVNNNKPILLCARKDSLCFTDKSTMGLDHAPIISWQWTFGDGGSSTRENPCYAYSDSGYYQVTLQITDSNGCTQFLQKTINVRYTTDSGINTNPTFKMSIAYNCKKNIQTVTFTNTTDTAGQFITNFIWNFGDGTGDTCYLPTPACLSKWTKFQHVYSKQGLYQPSLTIENKYGCIGSVSVDTPIIIDPYKLSVSVFPSMACFLQDSMAIDTVPPHPLALGYYWDYGDPYRRDPGVTNYDNHIYKFPGVYTVHIDVVIGTCHYDSTVCHAVKLLGPIALIMPEKGIKQAWDSVPPNGSFLINPSNYRKYFDTTCLSPGYAKYYTYKPVLVKNGEPVYDNCLVDTIKTYQKDSLYLCNGKKTPNILLSFKQHIDSYKDTTEQMATVHFWFKGDPIPSGNLYSDTPFVNRPLYMDDTSLFSLRCQAPQKITFTNFSEKYRGYYAIDNYPLAYPSICLNKSYPYASDSLTYFWDFKEGTRSTSTKKNPVITDRFSSEKLPTHLFRKNGCYWVVLTVTDSSTNCSDQDSLPVVLEEPNAGWDTAYRNIKDMTALIQDSLPANGPRRGMIVGGKPCIDSAQYIDLREILPGCFQRNFNMAFDSVKDVIHCNHLVSWKWLDKDTIAGPMSYTYDYQDTGWKTIGLVVTNNYNCTDTVWYHHYKYIHGTYAAINVSASHACLGDTIRMSPAIPQQLGIKSFTYYFTEQLDLGDTIAKPKTQTTRFKVLKQKNGSYDTITSTVHNRLWGIDDSANQNFNYLTDTNSIVIPYIGHVLITSVIVSRFGCSDTVRTQVTVGDYTDFSEDNTTVCTNDTVHFQGIAQYFVPFAPRGYSTGVSNINYWQNPDSARGGRVPKIPEKMEWDLNGDGIIDATGPYVYFKYTKPGKYTVTLYTTDSNGCVQTVTRKDLISVIGDSAYFTIASPGPTRYCNGSHLFQFIDSSHVIKPFKDSTNTYKIYSWTWNFGDGTPTLTVTDTTKKNAAHVYVKNGDYTVTLIIRTSPGTGANGHGCADTFKRIIHILGPTAKFSIVGANKGCVPFTVAVRDESLKAKIREWILGDSTSVTSYGDSIVYLTYKKPGVFCPQFFVADSLTDSTGKQLYCSDLYPPVKCQLTVTVWDTNKQVLTASDTLICLGKDSVYFKSSPDTGYSTWTLNFGDGDSATKATPNFSHLYTKTGKYHVKVSGSGAHCPDTASINVRVIDIKSYFTIDTAKNDTPTFSFINRSVGAVRYTWDFGDGSLPFPITSYQEISHPFIKAGKSVICLTSFNEKGCAAKYCDSLVIDTFLYIPNVFTPNGDAYNPVFDIVIFGNLGYHLNIYNRWGQKVFHSDDKRSMWDGINHSSGVPYPEGTYYYVLNYRFIGSKNEEKDGAVTLIR